MWCASLISGAAISSRPCACCFVVDTAKKIVFCVVLIVACSERSIQPMTEIMSQPQDTIQGHPD